PPSGLSLNTGGGQGKIVDGNRICNELGFEYQYPDPLVMPME
ncbi:SDR family NAD(P)-dependent oxidoreductase, partial [Klebsiella quasipneumoniae]|nr:SDR family NAD(P)-dependent oxidoreductase [Klebsiella quasipneumoniae]